MNFVDSSELCKIKVILIGSSGVGKTTVITKFIDKYFVEKGIPTIGIDFTGRTIYVDGRTVRLQIWDTAGQERFHSLIPSYVRVTQAAIVMYDVTDRTTFHEVKKWVNEVRKWTEASVPLLICGNKLDCEPRQVTQEEGEALAAEMDAVLIETSAKTGQNINTLFETAARKVLNTDRSGQPVVHESVLLEAEPLKNPGCTC